jgi:hypothetical protein
VFVVVADTLEFFPSPPGILTVLVRDVNEPPALVTQPDGIKIGSTTPNNSVVTILDFRDPDKDDVVTFHEVRASFFMATFVLLLLFC